MSQFIVLRDNLRADPLSKINNFTYEWIKWCPYVKFAPFNYTFNDDDVIIINFNDSVDPYEKYSINNKCKRIGIVHKINERNIKYIQDCSFLIYMNPILEKIASSRGIKKPNYICPKYPEYEFNGIEMAKLPQTFIGGWLDDTNADFIQSNIIEANRLTPQVNQLYISYAYGSSDLRKLQIKDALDDIIKNSLITNRHAYQNETILPLSILLFQLRISSHTYIESVSPKKELVLDLINTKSDDILKYDIGENAMLSMAKSAKSNIVCDESLIDFISLNNSEPFTYSMFGKNMNIIFKNN